MTTRPTLEAGQGDCDFQPLSAQDQMFLFAETDHTPMHVGATLILEAGPLAKIGAGIRFDQIRAHIAARLDRIPRYRQRVSFYPIGSRPHWVDDERFDLDHHVRHLRLPHPGNEHQLKQLCSQIFSQKLDRDRPLWEITVIEGLRGGRFALVAKTHHCLVDGIGGAHLLAALLDVDPEPSGEQPRFWMPRPHPSAAKILRLELARRIEQSLDWARDLRLLGRAPGDFAGKIGEQVGGITDFLGASISPAPDCLLNEPIGAQRRFEWLSFDLGEVKAIKDSLGGTVNDVVLATVAGALRRYLRHHQGRLPLEDLRALTPVNVRNDDEGDDIANHVSAYFVDLPVSVRNTGRRYRMTVERTRAIKGSKQAAGGKILATASVPLLSVLMRFAGWLKAYNVIVTNVPGPPLPLYLSGARLLEVFPLVPLFFNQGLGIALFSYAGKLHWGLNADRNVVPDVADFKRALVEAFAELAAADERRPPVRREVGTMTAAVPITAVGSRQVRPIRLRAASR